MKKATYNRLSMTIEHASYRGSYIITATIRGNVVKATTHDAEIYDYFDCDYYDTKDKNWARRAAYNAIMSHVVQVVVYKQGDNWVCNINGRESQLHYSIRTKADVRKYYAEASAEDVYVYKVTFA